MVNKENAKQQIKELLDKYKKVVKEGRIHKYNEEMTKAEFIEPLFEALGWDVRNRTHTDEVTREEKVSKGWVDYGFRIDGIPKFFLEAKSLKADLDKPEYAEQAINYAWHKGCTWAILTDFEAVKIFNAEWKTANLFQSRFISLDCNQFLEQFDELWLLSKESFEQGFLNKKAEKYGKKSKKSHVGGQLFSDLTKWRSELSKDISQRNKGINEVDLDEAVQRIIDRLIFIRNCEDRDLEAPRLLPTMREWDSNRKGALWEHVVQMFRRFDDEYNSKLFHTHQCERLDISNQVLMEVINGLYHTKDRSIRYDFSALDADVLGNVYEQYLGHILKKTAKRAIVKEKHAYRKEQGIYYTPTYIVDYIVRNTLGELLKDKKVDVEKIRVLDPACGSGSFLIKAFDVLNEFYIKREGDHAQIKFDLATSLPFKLKERILLNNIFGVDLDVRAVEIAQLNLLLKIAEKKKILPMLQQNIQNGNSLIDDEKIAGDKALVWQKEFKQIMDEGGFDVVIGNPPYVMVTTLNNNDKQFFEKYLTAFEQYNIYYLFIEKAINVLKENGILGFIVPIGFLNNKSGVKLRKLFLETCRILRILDVSNLDVFKDASTYPIIFIIQKENIKKRRNDNMIEVYDLVEKKLLQRISQKNVYENQDHAISLKSDSKISSILSKVQKTSKILSDIAFNYRGMQINKIKLSEQKVSVHKDEYIFPAVHLRDIVRGYLPLEPTRFAIHDDGEAGKEKRELFKNEKILIPRFVLKFQASYSGHGEYILDNIYIVQNKSKNIETKYLLALLNSKVIDFYYRYKYSQTHIAGGYFAINGKQIDNLPIKIVSETEQQPIIKLVDKILSLNKRLNEIGDKKTDARQRIEEEIKKTDAEIDELVYKLYEITDAEKKIIEESLK